MFVHAVYFWLKPGTKPEDIRRFEEKANAMLKIPTVVHGWLGKPAATSRSVIDSTYTYGLVVVFNDLQGHDAYQVHPIHDDFRDNCSMLWSAVKIYDSE